MSKNYYTPEYPDQIDQQLAHACTHNLQSYMYVKKRGILKDRQNRERKGDRQANSHNMGRAVAAWEPPKEIPSRKQRDD